MKTLLGLFLIAHGLVHAMYFTPKPNDPTYPFDFTKGWFYVAAGGPAKIIGASLVGLAILGFVLAGVAVLGVPGLASLWKLFFTIGAAASLVVFALFWHRWLAIGLLIDLVLLYGVYGLKWQLGA